MQKGHIDVSLLHPNLALAYVRLLRKIIHPLSRFGAHFRSRLRGKHQRQYGGLGGMPGHSVLLELAVSFCQAENSGMVRCGGAANAWRGQIASLRQDQLAIHLEAPTGGWGIGSGLAAAN